MTNDNYRFVNRYFLIYGLFFLIIVLVLGFYNLRQQKIELLLEKYDILKAVAEMKSEQLTQWYHERQTEALFFSTSPEYTSLFKDLASGRLTDETGLRRSLKEIMNDRRYENIFVIDTAGKLIFSVLQGYQIDSTTTSNVTKALKTGELVVNDFYYCNLHTKVHFDLVAPIYDSDRQNIRALLVLRVDPEDFLYPLIQKWPGQSKTAETVLARRDGNKVLFLNQLRYHTNTALRYSTDINDTIRPIVKAILGQTGICISDDYFGNKVLADLRKVENTPWSMVVKMELSEVYESLYSSTIIVLIFGILFIILITSIAAWIYLRREKNAFRRLYHKTNELFEIQSKLGTTLYCIGDGVIVTDAEGRVVNMNPVAEELVGYSEAESIGRPLEQVFSIINEETGEPVENPVNKVIREGRVVGLANHTILISKEGKETPVSTSGAPVQDPDGNFLGVVMVFTDQAEERLRQRLMKLRLDLFEFATSHNMVETLTKMLDDTEKLTNSSQSFLIFLNEEQSKVQFRVWSTNTLKTCRIPRSEHEFMLEKAGIWADCIRSRDPGIYNELPIAGSSGMPANHLSFSCILTVPVIRDGIVKAVIGLGNKPNGYKQIDVEIVSFLADVTWEVAEQKRKEERLIQSESRFSSMVGNLPGFVYRCLHDKNWTMLFVSKGIKAVTGYEISDVVINKKIYFADIIMPEYRDNIYLEWQKVIENNTHFQMEYRILHADGKIRWVWERGTGVYDSDGQLLYLEGYIEDITRRKQDEQLQQVLNDDLRVAKERAEESDRLKTAFLANMSHEIRTPMNGILGFLELLKEPDLADESRKEFIELVNISGQRLLSTINDIIEISKIESGEIEVRNNEVNLHEVLNYYYDFFRPQTAEKQINLICKNSLQGFEAYVITDRHKLDSILTNLIRNAIKFTRSGLIEYGCYKDNGCLAIYVKDTGVGIPTNRINAIFDRFVQAELNFAREFEGSGLGLSIVKAYTEALGGTISVESEIGIGSTFTVLLPHTMAVYARQTSGVSSLQPLPGLPYNGLNILIAEDDDISYKYLERSLRNSGIKLLRATNGEDAVRIMHEKTDISMILMDIKMPKMNGLEATQQIRMFNSSIPIIAQTAYSMSSDKDLALNAGCTDYISKPLTRTRLFAMIDKYFPVNLNHN